MHLLGLSYTKTNRHVLLYALNLHAYNSGYYSIYALGMLSILLVERNEGGDR